MHLKDRILVNRKAENHKSIDWGRFFNDHGLLIQFVLLNLESRRLGVLNIPDFLHHKLLQLDLVE